MLTGEEAKSFVKWYCNLINNKSTIPGVYLRIETHFAGLSSVKQSNNCSIRGDTGLVQYVALLYKTTKDGADVIIRSNHCSNPYASVCFLVVALVNYPHQDKLGEGLSLTDFILLRHWAWYNQAR